MLALVLGALAFLAVHAVLALTWSSPFWEARLDHPWFLGSRRGILLMQAVVLMAGLALGYRARQERVLPLVLAMTGGLAVAMVGIFAAAGSEELLVGRADLAPVALLAGALLTLPAVAIGIGGGALLQRLAERGR